MNNERIETTILSNLFYNEGFTRKTLPFLKPLYFNKRDERLLFEEIEKFVLQYKMFLQKNQSPLKLIIEKILMKKNTKVLKH